MNPAAALWRAAAGRGPGGAGRAPTTTRGRRPPPAAAAGIGLWVFIGVASTLFALFGAAYVMRMDGSDWSPIALPWQLALSTALLLAGSAALQRASNAARAGRTARRALLAGALATLAFLGSQLWAWQALLAAQVTLAGNPAASFFYLLTALHGLHVVGGLVAWVWAARSAWSTADSADAPRRIALCARYWHFLLAVWGLLYATLAGLTPELVRYLCGSA
jgi:cytochrome c oxidase subunit 3